MGQKAVKIDHRKLEAVLASQQLRVNALVNTAAKN
jgi:hypothetical protein